LLQAAMRGMTGSGDGVHVMTGPIYVKDAEPGDVLKVEILKLYPRLNPKGESYGVNVSIVVELQCCFAALDAVDCVLWICLQYESVWMLMHAVSGCCLVGIPLWH